MVFSDPVRFWSRTSSPNTKLDTCTDVCQWNSRNCFQHVYKHKENPTLGGPLLYKVFLNMTHVASVYEDKHF